MYRGKYLLPVLIFCCLPGFGHPFLSYNNRRYGLVAPSRSRLSFLAFSPGSDPDEPSEELSEELRKQPQKKGDEDDKAFDALKIAGEEADESLGEVSGENVERPAEEETSGPESSGLSSAKPVDLFPKLRRELAKARQDESTIERILEALKAASYESEEDFLFIVAGYQAMKDFAGLKAEIQTMPGMPTKSKSLPGMVATAAVKALEQASIAEGEKNAATVETTTSAATSTGKWFDAVCFNQLREVDAQADIATMQIADDEILYKCVEVNRTEEDSHDSVMHILRFPAARNLTALDADLGGEILFFRQDDLDLFDVLLDDENRNVVITGNPGTAKSWFQPKVITLLARPDIYRTMVEKSDAIYESMTEKAGRQGRKGIAGKPIGEGVPKLIYRMITKAEIDPVVFDLEGRRVLSLKAAEALPGGLNRYENWVLYEPSNDPAQPSWALYGNMKFVMTVSPLRSRYKQFIRRPRSAVFCMPCTTLEEMLVMGSVLAPLVPKDTVVPDLSEKGIRSSFQEFGPFPRYMLANARNRRGNRLLKNRAIQNLSPAEMLAVQASIEAATEDDAPPVSHWILAYQHPRDRTTGRVKDFQEDVTPLGASTEGVVDELIERLKGTSRADLLAIVCPYLGEEDEYRPDVGRAFQSLYKDWLTSNATLSSFDFNVAGEAKLGFSPRTWTPFEYDELKNVNRKSVPFEQMKKGTLYVPSERQYPFVDLMWRGSDTAGNDVLFAVQTTVAKTHAKKFSVFEKEWLQKKLGIEDVTKLKKGTKIRVLYAIKPRDANKYLEKPVQTSFMWENVADAKKKLPKYEGILSMAMLKPEASFDNWSPRWLDTVEPVSESEDE